MLFNSLQLAEYRQHKLCYNFSVFSFMVNIFYLLLKQIIYHVSPGETLFFNNRRFVHSRTGFKLNGGVRHFNVSLVLYSLSKYNEDFIKSEKSRSPKYISYNKSVYVFERFWYLFLLISGVLCAYWLSSKSVPTFG